ncbi:putative beta-1,4-xylosidase [Alteracholeplasma palmae J233]|uniref:Putative beta-1,4-xylosidase n=1 Tax=Alteracholeplasma palmae (strain ATCC 49389 / J233) TaxID=1318466 RepID=U4KRJ5_ALTPJ|nr:glycoside hydrolase family 43 protein [Alteracholeplasma palmae]CCV64221.1 putative beta-1,4-xylosidase [Alteracholeplasma palmae J233]
MSLVTNPVLRGFNPDPSSVKVGDTIYIAVSTFEWMPGVRIYQTKDLVNYEYVTDILTKSDFRGNPRDCSVWAPQISYVDGEFYVLYTDVKSTLRPFKDLHNYLVKSKSITGPWSEPIYLNSSGFDPSLFHDGEKSYLLNCIWDYRHHEPNKSVGIIIQEFDRKTNKLIDTYKKIFDGTEAAKTEAPHIYKLNDYYYLITAEGGTGKDHQVTVCRSKNVFGPYELDPQTPLLTSKNHPELKLQCAGHASLITMDNGDMYIFHLTTRPLENNFAILGRETALQSVILKDGWLRLKEGGNLPYDTVEVKSTVKQVINHDFKDDFKHKLHHEWNTLRNYDLSFLDVTSNGLKMISQESMQSLFDISLIGKRITTYDFTAKTEVEFNPERFNQMAGIGLYLNAENFFYAYLTYDEKVGKCIRYFKKSANEFTLYDKVTPINETKVVLEVVSENNLVDILVNGNKQNINEKITFLSGGFTGLYVTLSVHDLDYRNGATATFKYFEYKGKERG